MQKGRRKTLSRGFILVELLIVLAIIGILSTIVLVSSQKVLAKQKLTQARYEARQLQTAFEMYFLDRNDYPPVGQDFCGPCGHPWSNIMNELAPYLSKRLDTDPWGNAWQYDKNFKQPCWNAYSPVCSRGPNGQYDTNNCQGAGATASGDDICIFIEDED